MEAVTLHRTLREDPVDKARGHSALGLGPPPVDSCVVGTCHGYWQYPIQQLARLFNLADRGCRT